MSRRKGIGLTGFGAILHDGFDQIEQFVRNIVLFAMADSVVEQQQVRRRHFLQNFLGQIERERAQYQQQGHQ